MTAEGRELATDAGLVIQGVEDGGLITVAAGVDDAPPRVYDDVVEAMTDIVEHDLKPWSPAAGRRTALWAAGLFMALGAVALLIQRGSLLAGVAAAVVSAALVTGAIVLSRAQREPEAAVAVAWMGALYAGVAGLMLVTDDHLFGPPVAAAGGAVAVAGLICLVGLGPGPHPGAAARGRGRRLPRHRPADAGRRLRPRRRADGRAGPRRDPRQCLPVARPRRDRHVGRPALQRRRHHRRAAPGRPRPGRLPTLGSPTRSSSPSPRPSACCSC